MGPSKRYLYETYLEEGHGVSFKGQGFKWNTAEDVAAVVKAMSECRNMKYLELEGNTLGVDAAKEIGKALESHPELEIALWKDLFTTRDKSEIPKALDFLFAGVDLAGAHLQRLDLSDNAIGPMGMPGVTPFFRTPSSFYLEELIVNNEGMGPEGGSLFASVLTDCFELSQTSDRLLQMKVFQCGRNRQENKGAIAWAKLFEKLGSLEEIHMPQNGIFPPGIKALTEAFLKNPSLRLINLEDNTVRKDGCQMISDVLPRLKQLEELNLSDCLLLNTGATSLSSALRNLHQLQTVRLCANEIKGSGGIALAAVLRELPSLVYVDLTGNEFGPRTASDIERLLDTITKVVLRDEDDDEDDEGETGGDDEDDEDYEDVDDEEEEDGQNEEVEEEEEEYLKPELSPEKTRSGFNDMTGIQSEVRGQESDPCSAFIRNPTIESYMKLMPNPALVLKKHFGNQNASEFHDLCIFAALNIAQIQGPNGPGMTNELFDEALKSTSANGFATSVLTCLGFIGVEKTDVGSPLVCYPTEAMIQAVGDYLSQSTSAPLTIYLCLQRFVMDNLQSPRKSPAHQALGSAYQRLLERIKIRVEGITLY